MQREVQVEKSNAGNSLELDTTACLELSAAVTMGQQERYWAELPGRLATASLLTFVRPDTKKASSGI